MSEMSGRTASPRAAAARPTAILPRERLQQLGDVAASEVRRHPLVADRVLRPAMTSPTASIRSASTGGRPRRSPRPARRARLGATLERRSAEAARTTADLRPQVCEGLSEEVHTLNSAEGVRHCRLEKAGSTLKTAASMRVSSSVDPSPHRVEAPLPAPARRPSVLNHATFIWNAADILRGTYKQHQYGDVILPFTVLARLDAVLAPTKAVLAATAGYGLDIEIPQAAMLRAKAGHPHVLQPRRTIWRRCRATPTISRRTCATTCGRSRRTCATSSSVQVRRDDPRPGGP
jgi:hypothetical protein